MKSQLWWKWLIVLFLSVASIYLCTPPTNVYDEDGNLLHHGKIRLGLDLDGGTSFALELDREELRARLEEVNPDATKADIDVMENQAVASANETAVEIVRNRIDSLGTEEPVITKGQDGRIYVEIPGATAEQREQAERMIKSAAFLEFYLVATDNDEKCADLFAKGQAPQGYQVSRAGNWYVRDEKVPAPDPRALRRFGNPGPTKVFLLEKDRVQGTDQQIYRPLYVERKAKMTGAHLSSAGTTQDDMARTVVTLSFDAVGTKQFAQVTGKYAATDTRAGRYMAIVLDGVYYDWDMHSFVYPIVGTLGEIYTEAADGMVLGDPVSISATEEVAFSVFRDGEEVTGDLTNLNTPGSYVVNLKQGTATKRMFGFTLVGPSTNVIHTLRAPNGFYISSVTMDGEALFTDRYSLDMELEIFLKRKYIIK